MVTPARGPSATDAGRGSGRGGRQRGNHAANRGASRGGGGDGRSDVCRHYLRGSCNFGSDCHFRHDASASTASATSKTARGRGGRGNNEHGVQQTDQEARPPRSRGDYLPLHLRIKEPIRNQQTMRTLVRALEGVDANEAVALLASEDGGKRLDEFTSCPFVAQPYTESAYSFVGVIVPLLLIVVDNKFRQTALATSLQKVWPRLSYAEFITKAVDCACTDGLQPTSSWAREDCERWDICGKGEGLAGLVAHFILTLLRYERDVQADTQFEGWIKRIERRAPGSPWVASLRAIVDEANKKSSQKSAAAAAAAAATALRTKRATHASPPPGGRHDNDHRDFRATRIEPTQEEILTHARPYLPRADEDIPHATSDVGALLERHARLMREDMVVPLRRGVRAFLNVAAAPFKKALGSERVKVNACKDDELFGGRGGGQHEMGITALRHARFEGIVADKRKGPIVLISFDQMTSLSAKGKRERVDFWREHGLTPDSLVCIAANVRFNSEDGLTGLVFATVCAPPITAHDDNKWEALYGGDRCCIHVTPLDLMRDVSRLIALSETTVRGAENFVLQIQGHFYAGYKYVLDVLQNPLTETCPMLHTLASADTGMHMPQTDPLGSPEFFPYGTRVGISALLKDDAPAGTAKDVTINSYDGVREQLRAMLPVIRIDGTQVDAVAAILTRKIALIQGPPGTGKTHVGAIATKIILDHSLRMRAGVHMHRGAANAAIAVAPTPILCICFTNHALDQYLEALHVREGVPLKDIVRIGGRSRSELLAPRNLFTLERESFSNTTSGERARYAKLSRAMDVLAKDIEEHELMATLQLETASWDCVSEVFSVVDPVNHARINGRDGDFVAVGDVNKRWKKWVQGWVPKTTAAHAERQREVIRERVNQFSAIGESADNSGDGASSDGDAAATEDRFGQLWIVPVAERRRTAMACIETIRQAAIDQLAAALSEYQEKSNELAELRNASSVRILSKATVIGMTTSGCAKHANILQALEPPVVLCEEAGEVLESHVIASLSYGTKQLILIGDHKQLRPKVEYELSVESKRGYDLDVSLFERLVRIGEQETAASKDNDGGSSDVDAEDSVVGAETQARGAWHVTLDSQYRMRPEIANLIRSTLYPTLCNGDNVTSYPDARGFGRNLLFFDHDTPESKGGGAGLRSPKSYTNEFEAEMVVQLIRYAVKQGYKPDDIAVLATYTGQLLVLREKLTRERMLVRLSDGDAEELGLGLFDGEESTTNTDIGNRDNTRSSGAMGGSGGAGKQGKANDKAGQSKVDDGGPTAVSLRECVRLSTVDNFQGEEALLVFVSTVRCNDEGQIGFLKTSNRVNVMLSRAKHAMFVLGSSRTVDKRQGESMFKGVLQLMRDGNAVVRSIPLRCDNHQTITEVSTPTQIRSFCKDGGCTLSCNARMKCGHKCALTCHPDNRDHDPAGVCKETCTRLLQLCQHPCPKLCGQKCPTKCNKIEKRTLSCGHTKDAKCHEDVTTLKCDLLVDVTFPACGHAGKLKCCLRGEFEELCEAIADGNRATVHIGEANKAHIFDCRAPCGHGRDPCAHACRSTCGTCTHATALALAGDSGEVRISSLHTRTSHSGPCTQHCTRTMPLCGHTCGGGSCHAASDCPPCSSSCRIACAHSRCTEQCSVACAPCAEAECAWACTSDHPGSGRLVCLHPCAVPCERLPCDYRCTKTLLCGHACPCVCGERCADKIHCPECARNNGSDNGNCVVEFITSTTLAEHNTGKDPPLVILACNHAFTTAHLDLQLGMNMFYGRDDTEKWISAKNISAISDNELDDLAKRATCPLCRVPISGVLRYGRPLKAIDMRRAGILFLRKAQLTAAAHEKEAQFVRAQVDVDGTHVTGDSGDMKKAQKIALFMDKTLQQCINDAAASERNSPPQRVYELEVIASQRVGAAPSLRVAPLWQPVCRLYMAALRCATASLAISGVVAKRVSIVAADPVAHIPSRTAGKPDATDLTAATNAVKKAYTALVDMSVEHSRVSRESGARVECERGLLVAAEGHLVMAEIASQVASLQGEYMRRALADAKSVLADVGNASLLEARDELNRMLERIGKAKASLTIEEKRAVFAAMSGMGGYGVGSFGGHWKSCPNGHVYYVDACGGAMQQSTCPDCGAVIGGDNHTLVVGNSIATQFLADVGGELPPPNWEVNANMIAHDIHGFF